MNRRPKTLNEIAINHLLGELEGKCNQNGSTIEPYEAIASLTEIIKLQQKEIQRLSSVTIWGK